MGILEAGLLVLVKAHSRVFIVCILLSFARSLSAYVHAALDVSGFIIFFYYGLTVLSGAGVKWIVLRLSKVAE